MQWAASRLKPLPARKGGTAFIPLEVSERPRAPVIPDGGLKVPAANETSTGVVVSLEALEGAVTAA